MMVLGPLCDVFVLGFLLFESAWYCGTIAALSLCLRGFVGVCENLKECNAFA
jgi:hypothetical protein